MKNGKKLSLLTVSLIPIGVAVNFIGGQLTNLLKLPVYLDVIGTMIIGILGGPLAGVIVGALSNIINSITSPTNLPYIIVSIAIGLVSGLLSEKGMLLTKKKTFISGILLAILGTAMSAPITAFVFGGITGSGDSFIIIALQSIGIGLLPATLIATLTTEILDKVISCFVCYSILNSISERYLANFSLGKIYIDNRKKI